MLYILILLPIDYNYRHPYEDNGHAHREKREYHSNAKEARNTLRHGDQRRTSAAALAASASPMVTVTFAGETSQAKLGRVLAVGSHTR